MTCQKPDCPTCWFAWATALPLVLRSTDDLLLFADAPFRHPCLKANVAHRVFLVYVYLHLIARGHLETLRALRGFRWDADDPQVTWMVWNIVIGEDLSPFHPDWTGLRMLDLPKDPRDLLGRMGIH